MVHIRVVEVHECVRVYRVDIMNTAHDETAVFECSLAVRIDNRVTIRSTLAILIANR